MDVARFKKMEIGGIVFTFVSGALLHFVYAWSNGAVWSILFGAVNESVWEHVKIFAMPYLMWAIFELACTRPYFKMFVISKVLGLYFLSAATILFFYIYSGIVGQSVLAVDILSILIWLTLAHFISYGITMSFKDVRAWFVPALFALLLFGAMYFGFSAAPPKIDLFRDPSTGTYGLFTSETTATMQVFGGVE